LAAVQAAEANPRLVPLVKKMDQTGHVHSAFKQLQAMRAAAEVRKGPLPLVELSTLISASACNEAFPRYPALVVEA
jgi:hypothetical protein